MIIDEKELIRLFEETKTELKNVGIPISFNVESIKVNTRAKARFGCCKQEKKAFGKTVYHIEISKSVLACDEKSIKEIIAHELLHTCRGCMNHGKIWKSYAERLHRYYGYNISRTTSYEKLGLKPPERKGEEFRYKIICQNCGNTIYRKRQSRLTRFPENYRCGKCGGTLILCEKSTTSCR